jgi:hypothetical protein
MQEIPDIWKYIRKVARLISTRDDLLQLRYLKPEEEEEEEEE